MPPGLGSLDAALGKAIGYRLNHCHSAELNGANPFDCLVALLRKHAFVEENPEEWMPWNYQETLAGLAV